MSEPMSSGEIEDVLSSIRRLVSEDLRPAAKEGAEAVAKNLTKTVPNSGTGSPSAIGAGRGTKLLLTPALRVVSTQDTIPTAPQATAPAVADVVVDVVADFIVEEAPFMAVDDDAFDAPQLDSGKPDTGKPDTAVQGEDWLPENSDEAETYPGWARAEDAAQPVSDMSRVVHEIAAAVADSEDDWEPEAGDPALGTTSWQAPEWVEEAELVQDASELEAARKAIADLAEEAAVAEIMARATQAKNDAEAHDATAKTASKPNVDASTGAADDIFAEDEGYFDETVLRDLVRDLIREELSGTLGERITRNVRKLVRAEINRALTARDFD